MSGVAAASCAVGTAMFGQSGEMIIRFEGGELRWWGRVTHDMPATHEALPFVPFLTRAFLCLIFFFFFFSFFFLVLFFFFF